MQNEVVIPREQIKDRTLTLTHEQLQIIQDALSIAELHYNETWQRLCKNATAEEKKIAKFWFDKSNAFYDLNKDISNGDFDI